MDHDHHLHSTYSDGRFLWQMLPAAEAAGLDAVGVADHCMVSERESVRAARRSMGFNLDRTHDRRRQAIDRLTDEFDVRVIDAVEMDYHPDDEAAIRAFLDDAGFAYAVGSVHALDGHNVHFERPFEGYDDAERRDAVRRFFDREVALIESGLFAVAAHLDLVERNRVLRGHATRADYERVADALADSRTVPELNAGRVLDEYGEFHPAPPFVEVLADRGVEFVCSTDAHSPEVVGPRVEALSARVDDLGVATTSVIG
jgi:histidinol-phosphatase (PHP family)